MNRSTVAASLYAAALAALTLAVTDAHAAAPEVPTDPWVMHAEALLAEADGNAPHALELLRRAVAAAPEDELLRFELARLALAHPSAAKPTDGDAFLARTPATADAQLLRAYLLLERRDKEGALAAARGVLKERPNDGEALALTAALAEPLEEAQDDVPTFTGKVTLGAQYDSNVTVVPDELEGAVEAAPSKTPGTRAQLAAELSYRPVTGPTGFELTLAAQHGPHLTDRDALALYDASSVGLDARLQVRKRVHVTLDAGGSLTFLDSFAEVFMREATARLSLAVPRGTMRVGAFAGAAARDFAFGNPEDTAATPQPADRDGLRLDGGVQFDVTTKSGWLVLARVGFQAEQTDGETQRERGPMAQAAVRYSREAFWAQLSGGYERREYTELDRLDQRIVPRLALGYAVTEAITLAGSYAYVRNDSATPYGYERQLAGASIELRF